MNAQWQNTLVNPLTRRDAEGASELFKILANPNRLQIVAALALGEYPVGDLESMLGIKQPTLSQQLAELREAGLVETRREAKQVFYRLGDKRILALLYALPTILQGIVPDPQDTVSRSKIRSGAAMFARIETASM